MKDAFDRDTVASLCVLAALGGAKSYRVLYLNSYSGVLLSCVVGLEVKESHRLYFKKARTTSYISVMPVFVTGLLRKPARSGWHGPSNGRGSRDSIHLCVCLPC